MDVPEEDAAHVDVLWLLVVVEVVGAVALGLPVLVALQRARRLRILQSTSPQAAQMAWSASWPSAFPQMHLMPSRGSSIRYPRLKSLSLPSPSCLFTFTNWGQDYGQGSSAAGCAPPSTPGRSAVRRNDSGRGRWRSASCSAASPAGWGACRSAR